MTYNELLALLPTEIKGLSNYLVSVDYENAVNDAIRETGWALPVVGYNAQQSALVELWLKSRAKRHLFFYLMSESAHKFKYDVIFLNQRFDHYSTIIKQMDDNWNQFINDYPELFITNASDWFGTKVDAGFAYEETGEDITYNPSVVTIFSSEGV